MKIGRVSIPFVKYNSDVPVISFRLKDKNLYAIIDTGAEVSLFDDKLKDLLEVVSMQNAKMVGVSGTTQESIMPVISGEVHIPTVNNGLFITRIEGLYMDMTNISNHFSEIIGNDKKISCIIGSDVLNKLKAKIDFVKQEITFKL